LPGKTKDVSGSCFGGSNIAASKYSDPDKQNAALKVIEYVTSKNIQKEFIMKYNYLSGIYSLYDDEDVCQKLDCELYKSIQPTIRSTMDNDDYDDYSTEFRRQIYKFLYENTDAKEALQGVIDIKHIYNISIVNSTYELLVYILLWIIVAIIAISMIFIFIPLFKFYFVFLSNDLWIISLVGLIMIQCICFTEFGEITLFKCHLRLFLLAIGFSLNMIPILYQLIVNFPDENKISHWIKEHRYFFISIFIFIDIIMNLLLFIKPYKVNEMRVIDGKNFNYCELDDLYSKIIEIVFSFIKILVFLALLTLIFLEWNLEGTYYDIRFLITAVYIDVLDFILILMVNMFEINNYKTYFILKEVVFIIYTITTYTFLYGYRIFYYFIYGDSKNSIENLNKMSSNIRKYTANNINDSVKKYSSSNGKTNNSSLNNTLRVKNTNSISDLTKKILNYHFRKEYNTSNITCLTSENSTDNNSNTCRSNS